MQNKEKIEELREKLKDYENKLARAMIGYRGVTHESAVSELKHNKVMVLRAMIRGLKEEIVKLENNFPPKLSSEGEQAE